MTQAEYTTLLFLYGTKEGVDDCIPPLAWFERGVSGRQVIDCKGMSIEEIYLEQARNVRRAT